MRNSKISLIVMTATFALVAGVAYALGQQEPQQTPPPTPPPQQTTPQTPPATPPAQTPPPEAGESAAEPEDPKAPKRFIPSQRTSADNNATFPVDI